MALEDGSGDLGEIRAGDDLDTLFVASVHQVPEVKTVNIGTLCVICKLRVITCDQSGRIEHDHVAGKRVQLSQKLLLIEINCINLSEIGLDYAPGIVVPPVCHLFLLFYLWPALWAACLPVFYT